MNAKFRAAFQIPVDHTLKETSFRSKSSSQYESWKHEEYDASGELVARYESWMNTTIRPIVTTSGWRKIDPAGNVISEANNLPI